MLRADPGEVDRRLGRLALPAQVDDDPFAERRVLDVVADAQAEVVGVARFRRAATGGERGLDDPLAVGVGCGAPSSLVVAATRRRYGGGVPQSDRGRGSGGRRRCAP